MTNGHDISVTFKPRLRAIKMNLIKFREEIITERCDFGMKIQSLLLTNRASFIRVRVKKHLQFGEKYFSQTGCSVYQGY